MTIKAEAVYNETYQNHDLATTSLFKWIETWFNRKRRHSALGYKTIEEFEILNNNQKQDDKISYAEIKQKIGESNPVIEYC